MSEASELRQMSDEQLTAMVDEACKTLFRLRIQAKTERLDVPTELRRNRRLIARIRTIQRERQPAPPDKRTRRKARKAAAARSSAVPSGAR
jgi:large subunit ribosomal protein L29